MKIKTFNNTNFFIYNENGIKIYPTSIDINSTLVININENDIIIENDDFNYIIDVFDKFGFEFKNNIEYNVQEDNEDNSTLLG